MTESKRKYQNNNIKNVTLTYKIDDFEKIKTIATDNNTTVSALIKATYNYCIDNNIDITAYLK